MVEYLPGMSKALDLTFNGSYVYACTHTYAHTYERGGAKLYFSLPD